MARRGRFGRSGTSQNLTMLVYQIMKQQMQDELDAILTSYNTNMEAGTYQSQFNGQNVDGEFVISYYESMLAGFPPGSTEYETVSSKLEQFRQRYQSDIERLVIDSMNNGTKIDFGLLGSGFQNKGISEVELVDVRGWADERIAQLKADGNDTAADKLSGAVYVAGFNVEHDGKIAAVDRGEMSYGAYAKWLKGQLGDALGAGLTKSSDAYRGILKAHANAVKQAKAEGESSARDRVDKEMRSDVAPVEAAAKALVDKYINSADPVMAQSIYDTLSQTPQGSMSPYFDALQTLAQLKQGGDQTYNAIMNASGVDQAADLFAQSVSEYTDQLDNMLDGGLKGLSEADASRMRSELAARIATQQGFISNSGVEFFTGMGKTTISTFRRNLQAAGVSFSPDLSQGTDAGVGGHPTAVLGVFKDLSEDLKAMGGDKAYPWLTALANGYIPTDLDPESLSSLDSSEDGRVTVEEIQAAADSGNFTVGTINAITSGIIATSGSLDIPASRITPESLIKLWLDSAYVERDLKSGKRIAVINEAGVVSVTEQYNVNKTNAVPFIMGEYGLVYSLPVSMTEKGEGEAPGPIDKGKLGGFDVTVHRYPGLGASATNIGVNDAMVRISGPLSGGDGQSSQGTLVVPFDTYRKVLQYIGLEVESESFFSPTADVRPSIDVSFDGQTMSGTELQSFMKDVFTNPGSTNYIANLKWNTGPNAGQPVAPEASGKDYRFNGFINPELDTNSYINGLFSGGRDSILDKVRGKLASDAPGIPVSRENIIATIVNDIKGLGGGVQDTTVKDFVVNSKTFQDRMTALFPEFKAVPDQFQTAPYGYGSIPVSTTSPKPVDPAGPYQNTYMQNQTGQNFLDGAFRNAPMMGVGAAQRTPQPGVTATKPDSVPTIKPFKPTSYTPPKPYTPPTTTTAKPKVTQAGVTGATPGVNSGYTRGVS